MNIKLTERPGTLRIKFECELNELLSFKTITFTNTQYYLQSEKTMFPFMNDIIQAKASGNRARYLLAIKNLKNHNINFSDLLRHAYNWRIITEETEIYGKLEDADNTTYFGIKTGLLSIGHLIGTDSFIS
jgi:hypothetical protein